MPVASLQQPAYSSSAAQGKNKTLGQTVIVQKCRECLLMASHLRYITAAISQYEY